MNEPDDSNMQEDPQALRELEETIDRYGSDPALWPPTAVAARQLLEISAAARAALANARCVNEWLDSLREHQAPAGLAATILQRAGRSEVPAAAAPPPLIEADPVERTLAWLTARLWRPAVLAAVPVVLGFLLGLGLPQAGDTELAGQLGELAFIDLYQEFDDVH